MCLSGRFKNEQPIASFSGFLEGLSLLLFLGSLNGLHVLLDLVSRGLGHVFYVGVLV